MQFPPPRPRAARDTVLPMINVVFLLLIFFLMSAQIAPAPPFDLSAPEGESAPETLPVQVLWVSSEGALMHDGLQDAQALEALAMHGAPVLLRADAGLDAGALAQLLQTLGALGLSEVSLATNLRSAP